jgi:hypothetical protein
MGKFTKKLKKGLKKAAPLIMAGLAAKAMMGRGKKYNTSPVSVDSGRGSNLRNILKSRMPANLSKSMGPYRDNTGEGAYTLADPKWGRWDANYMAKGGRVTGIAKRGFGRALKKGRK